MRPRLTSETPGPHKPVEEILEPREALELANARCRYHEDRHPDLFSCEHISDYIDRALDLLLDEERLRARARRLLELGCDAAAIATLMCIPAPSPQLRNLWRALELHDAGEVDAEQLASALGRYVTWAKS